MKRFLCLPVVFWIACGPDNDSDLVRPESWWAQLPRPGYASLERVDVEGVADDWFEVYELLEGTYAIYEPYQFQEAICYLVLGDERAALVDSGNGIGDVRAVVSRLTDLPVTVLLTHEHPDHYGGASAFASVALFDDPRAVERVRAGVPNEKARRSITGDQVWRRLPLIGPGGRAPLRVPARVAARAATKPGTGAAEPEQSQRRRFWNISLRESVPTGTRRGPRGRKVGGVIVRV